MRETPLPFSRPAIGDDEIAEVLEVLRSGWITSGPRVKRFEEDFAAYSRAPHALAVTSCTAGIHLALLAHGIGPGDEVVVPSMTWPATVNMVEQVGATPVFADVDRETLIVPPAEFERRLTERTKAILPVHFAGQAADLDALDALCRPRGIAILEDAAHAVGTEYRGRRIGEDGRTTCFSFHPIKNITTGEGGMVTTADADLAGRIRLLRFHGVSRDAWAAYGSRSTARYESVLPGFKYNLTDIQAALGVHQLARLDGFIARRAELACRYHGALADLDVVKPLGLAEGTTRHAWHLFIVAVDPDRLGVGRDEFMERLKVKNIGTGLHFTAVHLHRYYREKYGLAEGTLPASEWASERVVSLPLFPGMEETDVDDVADAIREVAVEAGG